MMKQNKQSKYLYNGTINNPKQLTMKGEAPADLARYSNSPAVNKRTAPLVEASIQAQGIKP